MIDYIYAMPRCEYEAWLTQGFFGFVWLLILFVLTLGDYVTRGWIPFPGR